MGSGCLKSGALDASDLFYRPHICGIGGIGTSGVALLLADLGLCVTGSDLRPSELTQLLVDCGIAVTFDEETDRLRDATCLICPASFPSHHPFLQFAHQHHIPVLDRSHALALICRRYVSHAILCLGTLSRSAGARQIAQAIRGAGWCAGAAWRDGSLHAVFGDPLVVDLDERDFFWDPTLFEEFDNADVVITDWQQPDFGYYPKGFELMGLVHQFVDKHQPCLVYPAAVSDNACEIQTIQHTRKTGADWGCAQRLHRFERNASNRLVVPERCGNGELEIGDAPGCVSMAASVRAYLHLLACQETPKSPACIGWFENIDALGRWVYDIRMHPVNLAASLQALNLRWKNNRLVLVIRPFVSTLFRYERSVWCQALAVADRIWVITPPYPGCTDADCVQFAQNLRDAGKDARCVPEASIAQSVEKNDAVLFCGAPDMLDMGRQILG